ncbi:MAG TPA: FAD-dependent oxidoreductase [Anaerolineaceae bacterium]
MSKPHAIIIGAGFTGCATAHDLALRGFDVTVLERGDIATGTSGRTHGLLHSGGRYCVNDQESAIECIDESRILKQIAGQCIEYNGGLFIALDESDLDYEEAFTTGAQMCHIPVQQVSPQEALRMEPNINPKLLAAFLIPDGTFDPLRLALAFAATAKSNGARFKLYCQVEKLLVDGSSNVTGVRYWDRTNGEHKEISGDIVVSATGAWAGEVAGMAGAHVPVKPTPGVMVAFDNRWTERPINRLNKPGDGDIVLPQRRMVVVGTTSFEAEDVNYIPVVQDQVQMMIERGAELIPGLRTAKMRGAYMSSRPLIGSGSQARSIARTFKCFDHKESDGLGNFVTITGGKATTCRAMAEATANMVCSKLGVTAACQTKDTVLASFRQYYQN